MTLFESSARGSVLRTAAFYTPLFLGAVAVALIILLGVWDGGPVLLVIMLILAVLFGYQSIQSLRDLREQPRTTRGPVRRIWSKMDLFITRSHYIAVDRSIFRIPVEAHFDLREEAKRLRAANLEDDYLIEVEVVHYPHTGTVDSVRRLGQVLRKDDG
jgi:hypothetical protein